MPRPQSALKEGSVYRNADALVNPHALFDIPWTLNLRSERIRKDSQNHTLVKAWPASRLPSRLRHLQRIAECAHHAHALPLHGGIVSRLLPVASRRSRSRTRRVASKFDGCFYRFCPSASITKGPCKRPRNVPQFLVPTGRNLGHLAATFLRSDMLRLLFGSFLCSTMVWGRRRCRGSCRCECLALCESLRRCPNLR